MATGGGGESIGKANIELGVDTSKLDAGMAAAKANVEAQAATIEQAANTAGGGAADPSADLWAVKAQVEERNRLADATANAGNVAVEAISEEQRYAQALFDMRKRDLSEHVQRMEENRSLGREDYNQRKQTSELAVEAISEEDRYQQALYNMRKKDLATHVEINQQKKAAANAESALTDQTRRTANAVREIGANGEEISGPGGFIQELSGDMKEATKLFATFGKLAIFKQVALDAYALGQAIREGIIGQLKTGGERAREFTDSVLTNEPQQRAEEFRKRLDEINGQLALMSEFSDTSPVDPLNVETYSTAIDGAYNLLKGVTKDSLIEERNAIQERLKQNLELINNVGQRNKEAQIEARADAVRTATERMQAEVEADPAAKLNAEYLAKRKAVIEQIDKEQSDSVRAALEDQLTALYDLQAVELNKIQTEAQAKLDAENLAKQTKDQHEAELSADRLQNIKDQNEAAAISMIDDPRLRAESEYKSARSKVERDIANEKDALIKTELQNKLALLDQQHTITMRNIDTEEAEKRAAQARSAAEFQRTINEQFAQMRGEINSLFNTGNVEVGINRLGSLLEVLIQKTGDSR
jgi:hypothetical protein